VAEIRLDMSHWPSDKHSGSKVSGANG
jgi:hypothetical protein